VSDKSYSDFVQKKSVHINLNKETHSAFRTVLFKRGLSMQETFEELALRVGLEDSSLLDMLDELIEKKRNKTKASLSETDAEKLFNILEEESPFSS